MPSRELCPYAKCYCEENVWKLCELIKDKGENLLERYSVVFISNEAKTVPLWKQKASSQGQDMDYLVIWDYHVILLESQPQSDTEEDKTSGLRSRKNRVYDLDTVLEFPCDLDIYFQHSIRVGNATCHRVARKFFPTALKRNFLLALNFEKKSAPKIALKVVLVH